MVRLINGEIVPDDDPRLKPTPSYTPQPFSSRSSSSTHRLMPDTQGRFGLLSQSINLYGYEIEYIWIIGLLASLMMFGWRGMILIFIVFWIYQTNTQPLNVQSSQNNPTYTQSTQQTPKKDVGKFMSIRDVRGDKMN